MKTILMSLALLTTLILAGCSNQQAPQNPTTKTQKEQQQTIPENKIIKDDTKHMDGMGDSMGEMGHANITNEEQFIAEMIPHHQEAVDTAKIIVSRGENPTLKKLAQAIIDGQSSEISLLQGWMSSWYPSSSYKVSYKNMMRPLDTVTGHDLDDQFMQDMIKHHQGAITMAQQVLDVSQKQEIVKFANDVISAQSSEIKEFQKLLDAKDRH